MTASLDTELLNRCAEDRLGPVALHLRQELVPAEGQGAPFFPPTFATDTKYNIDELADGTRVALVDSVGSQANRMEPIFLDDGYRELVPQINISYGDPKKGTDGRISLLQVGHRLGDALVRCTELAEEAKAAFVALKRRDAEPIARLAPTSLVFGAWDSRDTGTKVPRIVQATIRAWDVSRLSRSAQFNPALDYAELEVMKDEGEMKQAERDGYAERGFLHVPSTGDPGGIVAHGPIRRDITVNLVALRRLAGGDNGKLRRYLLGLSLVAVTAPFDPFLRQGCLLVLDPDTPATWCLVDRSGIRSELTLDHGAVLGWARAAAAAFGVSDPREFQFDERLAKQDLAKGKKK
ncbi:MAG: type I-U CRISPR-associated protein Cas7 [Planctomycetes bacterium]|nr:type I-U CRISPR-associated protein Cas7 [Planctomycetota bacterium]